MRTFRTFRTGQKLRFEDSDVKAKPATSGDFLDSPAVAKSKQLQV